MALSVLVLGLATVAAAEPPVPPEWRTRAEASGFRATSSYEETLDFLRRVEKRLPEMKLDYFGTSGAGRKLPMVVVSKDRVFSAEGARARRRPIVFVQNGIHAGEIDGKDACLMILRDLALGRRRELLDAATLVILPIYNVDGHERVSPHNRPNQDGPAEGMGFRTTAAGLDLNRDHMKVASEEARALVALLAEVARTGAQLVQAVSEAEAATVAAGRPDAPASQAVLSYEDPGATETLRVPFYAWRVEDSVVRGKPLLRYERGRLAEREVPWFHRARAAPRTVSRPRGYLVPTGWPQVEDRLRRHGLRVARLAEPAELEVETVRVSQPRFAARTYQGLTQVEDVKVARARETRRFAAGTLWVPADQPDFEVAVHLLEPEAPDSLLSWGLLSSVFESKEYISPWVLEELAALMLRDPARRAEWEAALADEAFARDPAARHLWWYRRTPYWDDTIGLLPAFRVLQAPSFSTRPGP